MKKLLSILLSLALLVASFCSMSFAVFAEDGEAGKVIVDPELFPVGPSGKSFMHNPTTYCNPISLTNGSQRVITAGEPVITMFEDDYYLFVRGLRGYWWSHDFINWNYVDAPNFLGGIPGVVNIDGKLYCYAGNSETRVRATDDPKSGVWYDVGTFSSNNYGDASMLYDEETGRLFMFYGWSQILGIRVVEIDKTTFKEISDPVVCLWGDPHNHGWETRYSDDLIYPFFSHRQYRPEEYGWTEGGHPLKYNGKYYLLYASIGLEFYSYSHGVYVADDPMGPYVYSEHNPLTMKTTGVAPGAGHGSIFVDRDNNVWTVCMTGYTLNGGNGNTLIQLFPTAVDEDGVMHGNTAFGDYPQYIPGIKKNPIDENYTGWVLLSLDKRVEVSSTTENYWPAFAVDEDPKSYWCAQTGDPGEYITVDLGEVCDIRGIQVLWDRNGSGGFTPLNRYQSYTIEVSNDNKNWTLIIDKSNNPQDLRTDYVELPAPVYARYVKLTNVFTPDNGKFAVKALRVFGNPDKATFTKVNNVMAVRSILDRRVADLLWEPVPGAEGYIVRYGIEPDKLYNNYMVYWDNHLHIRSLNVNPEYYFEVEAFSSGTPRYVENTFETRGRGAELDLIRQPDGGQRTTDRVMTYETYGRDEVYVFENITPGTYQLNHTFGMKIWGPVQLTAEQLIGEGTEPTYTALNLMEFGIGSTRWGTIEVRVYPGPTSGRIEVTFNYDDDIEPPVLTPKVSLTGSDSVQPGSEFTVGVSLNTAGKDVYAEDIILSYDPDVFEYVATTGATEYIKVLKSDPSGAGTIRIVAANIGGVNSNNFSILNVTFKVKSGVENATGTIAVTQAKLGVAPSGDILNAELDTKSISIGGGTIPTVDKTALIAAINNAQSLYDNAVVGTEPGQYPQEAKDALLAAINAAKAVRDNPAATQAEVDDAVTALNTAVEAFKAAVIKPSDINNDGKTDVGDLAIIAYHYGKDSTSPDWDTAKIADVNGDNKIDIEDLAYVASKIK